MHACIYIHVHTHTYIQVLTLRELAEDDANKARILGADGAARIAQTLDVHTADTDLVHAAVDLLRVLACHADAHPRVAAAGCIEAILRGMAAHSGSAALQVAGCGALSALAEKGAALKTPVNAYRMLQANACDSVVAAMDIHIADAGVQAQGCRTLWRLQDQPPSTASAQAWARACLRARQRHEQDVRQLRVANGRMPSVVTWAPFPNARTALPVPGAPALEPAIDSIVAATKTHKGSNVQFYGCGALGAIAAADASTIPYLVELGGIRVLADAVVAHAVDQDMVSAHERRGMDALWMIASHADSEMQAGASLLSMAKGVADILHVLQEHRGHHGLQLLAAWSLWMLATKEAEAVAEVRAAVTAKVVRQELLARASQQVRVAARLSSAHETAAMGASLQAQDKRAAALRARNAASAAADDARAGREALPGVLRQMSEELVKMTKPSIEKTERKIQEAAEREEARAQAETAALAAEREAHAAMLSKTQAAAAAQHALTQEQEAREAKWGAAGALAAAEAAERSAQTCIQIGSAGGIPIMLEALGRWVVRDSDEDKEQGTEVVAVLLSALERLAQNPENADLIAAAGGVQRSVELLGVLVQCNHYPFSAEVALSACALLQSLAARPGIAADVCRLQGIEMLNAVIGTCEAKGDIWNGSGEHQFALASKYASNVKHSILATCQEEDSTFTAPDCPTDRYVPYATHVTFESPCPPDDWHVWIAGSLHRKDATGLWRQVPLAAGLLWEHIGTSKPSQGRELTNPDWPAMVELGNMLMSSTRLTEEERDSLDIWGGIGLLRSDDFIEAGGSYYRPADPIEPGRD